MNRIFIFVFLLCSLFLQGCKSTAPIKQPAQSHSLTDQTGDNVFGMFPLAGGESLLLRSNGSKVVNALWLDAGGALKSASQYAFTAFSGRGGVQPIQFNGGQAFGLASQDAFISLDPQGNVLGQGDWKDLFGLTGYAPNAYPSVTFLGNNDNEVCAAYVANKQYHVGCFDVNASLIWGMTLAPNSDGKLHGIKGALDQQGNLYLMVESGDQDSLRAYAPGGTLLWQQPADAMAGAYVKALQMVNGKLLLVRYDMQDAEHNSYQFLQYGLDGTPGASVSVDTLTDNFYLTPYDDNSYLVLTAGRNIELSRISQDGSLIWKKVFASRFLNLEFNSQETPIKVDSQGNIVMINQKITGFLVQPFFPFTVTNQYYMTRLNGNGVKIQEDLVGRNRYRVLGDTVPTKTLESGFAPDEFLLTADGYLLAGVNTYDLAEDNPDAPPAPSLIVNLYHW